MSLQTIVDVTITKESATVARTGFGKPLIAAFFSTDHFTDRAREYEDLDGLGDDGFGEDHWVYKKAQAILAQNPKVDSFIVGRRASGVDRSVKLTPTASPPALTAYKVTVNDREATFTTDASPTVAEVCTGITSAINGTMPSAWANTTAYAVGDRVKNGGNCYKATTAGTSAASGGPTGTKKAITDGTVVWKFTGSTATATDNTTNVVVAQDTAGSPFHIEVEKRNLWTVKDETADPGIVADVTAIRTDLTGDDTWYAAVTDSHDEASIKALAAYIETLRKLYVATCSDDELQTSATTDLGSDLETAAYAQTALLQHVDTGQAPDAAWVGKLLPYDPGSETWKFKTLAGIDAVKLTAAETTFLEGKNVNSYQTVAGVNITSEGVTASGEYIDVTRTIHALTSAIEEDVYAVLVSNVKVAFTDAGIALIDNALRGVLQRYVTSGALASYTVDVPLESEVATADKAARVLRTIAFTAELAGAIHKVVINGKLTV